MWNFKCPVCTQPTAEKGECDECERRRVERERIAQKRADPAYRADENRRNMLRMRERRARLRQAEVRP